MPPTNMIASDAPPAEVQSALDDIAANIPEGLYVAISSSLKRLRENEHPDSASDECSWSDARSIVATYEDKTIFPIPHNMDKNAEWYIKWDRLHYKDTKGDMKVCDPIMGIEPDRKRPHTIAYMNDFIDEDVDEDA